MVKVLVHHPGTVGVGRPFWQYVWAQVTRVSPRISESRPFEACWVCVSVASVFDVRLTLMCNRRWLVCPGSVCITIDMGRHTLCRRRRAHSWSVCGLAACGAVTSLCTSLREGRHGAPCATCSRGHVQHATCNVRDTSCAAIRDGLSKIEVVLQLLMTLPPCSPTS